MRQGKEQFGDEHAKKLSQLVITLRNNIMVTFSVSVTLTSTEWFTNTIPSSLMTFIAQNLMEY